MATLAELEVYLAELELAYKKLLTGKSVTSVEHADMKTEYFNSVTSMQMLKSEIANVKAQIAAAGGTVSGLRRRAIQVDLPGNC